MEISKDALLRVVKATRLTLRLAEDMKALLATRKAQTVPDQIADHLCDALFRMSGEQTTVDDSFLNTYTMALLRGRLSDGEVADAIMNFSKTNADSAGNEPKFMPREEIRRLFRENGGYMYESPEGEWSK